MIVCLYNSSLFHIKQYCFWSYSILFTKHWKFELWVNWVSKEQVFNISLQVNRHHTWKTDKMEEKCDYLKMIQWYSYWNYQHVGVSFEMCLIFEWHPLFPMLKLFLAITAITFYVSKYLTNNKILKAWKNANINNFLLAQGWKKVY